MEKQTNSFLNQATNYTAYDFFVDRMKIGTAMQDALNTEFRNSCYCTIDFFQLRSGFFFFFFLNIF